MRCPKKLLSLYFNTSALMVTFNLVACVQRQFNTDRDFRPAQSLPISQSVRIENSLNQSIDSNELRKTLETGIRYYAEKIHPVSETIAVALGGQSCLRTGYQFEFKKIVFCNNTDTIALGTKSNDVIQHELFHALICQSKPEFCERTLMKARDHIAVHEALADLFARQFAPDDAFGEQFYKDKPHIRNYRTSLCLNLAEGEHARGNALLSAMLDAGADTRTIQQILNQNHFSIEKISTLLKLEDTCLSANGPALELIPESGERSTLNRYRIPKAGKMKFNVLTNDAFATRFPKAQLRVRMDRGLFAISEGKDERSQSFLQFSPVKDQGWEKVTVQIYSDGLVGEKSLYLSIQDTPN